MKPAQSFSIGLSLAMGIALTQPGRLEAQNPANDFSLQSFLSPSAGSFLTDISFGGILFSANTIAFDLRQFDGTAPVGPSLFYFQESGEQLPQGPYFLPVNVLLAPATTYAIVFERNPPGAAGTTLLPGTTFPNGSYYNKSGNVWTNSGFDMQGFAPTFTAAPEPTTLLLLAPALGVLGIVARKRRR